MSRRSKPCWFAFDLRANEIEFREISLRLRDQHPPDFEIVVRDRLLGSFALHEGFLLEIPRREEKLDGWESVTLTELRQDVWTQARSVCMEPVARTDGQSSPAKSPERVFRGTFERIPVEGDASHLDRAVEALRRGGIRFEIIGGLNSRGRAEHLTLAVPSLLGARTCLRRAGFLETSESKCVLVDSPSGWKVCVLQGNPNRSRAN